MTFIFFFSSRRRHTRSKRDWSSDVCSSDLDAFGDTGQTLTIVSAHRDGRLVAILPLTRAERLWRKWLPVSNCHTPYVVLASERPPLAAAEAILDRLLQSSDVIDVEPVQPGTALS